MLSGRAVEEIVSKNPFMVKKTLEIMYCGKLRCLSEKRAAGPV